LAQHYEGASTLFGPYTLQAYQQEFRKLAIALRNGNRVEPGPRPPGNSSPIAGRWTFRNLSTEVALNYYYKSFDNRVDFIRKGDESLLSPHPETFEPIKIPAYQDVAFPKGLTDTFNKTYTTATLSIAGTQKSFRIGDLVTITGGGIEVTEYKPPTRKMGIGGYNLLDGRDQAFAFDYTGSGKLDHLFFYRPRSATFSIVTCKQCQFLTVYKESDVEATDDGIGPWMFQRYSNLRGFAFDYLSQGRLDHVAFYAPGPIIKGFDGIMRGFFTIAKRHPRDRDHYDWQGYPGPLTQSCDMSDPNDKAFAFDYGNGYVNHVVVYRPGTGKIWILGLSSDGFHYEEKWQSQNGIAGFELLDQRDLGLAFDYEATGRLDHLVFYRPGTGIVRIIKKEGNEFRSVYESRAGIGGWDLSSPLDRIIAFDYADASKPGHYYHDHLVCYRPGSGVIRILGRGFIGGLPIFTSDTGIGTYDLKDSTDQMLAFDYKGDAGSERAATSSGPSELFLFRPGSGAAFIVKKEPGFADRTQKVRPSPGVAEDQRKCGTGTQSNRRRRRRSSGAELYELRRVLAYPRLRF
jgi:hypothetical protein